MAYNSYTYIVTNLITGEFYIGSRYANVTANRAPVDDLWIKYYTSSKSVKALLKEYGKESFNVNIIKEDENYDICYWAEQEEIKRNIKNPLCLNKSYINNNTNRKFSMAGTTRVHSETTKKKISESLVGRPSALKGKKQSVEQLAKLSESRQKRRWSAETKQKMSIAQQKRRADEANQNLPAKLPSPELRKSRSEAGKLGAYKRWNKDAVYL